jgi:hypothetical protein
LGAVIITERVYNSSLQFKRHKRGFISSSKFSCIYGEINGAAENVCVFKSERGRDRQGGEIQKVELKEPLRF